MQRLTCGAQGVGRARLQGQLRDDGNRIWRKRRLLSPLSHRKSDIRGGRDPREGRGPRGCGDREGFSSWLWPQLLLPSSDKTVLLFNVNSGQVSGGFSHKSQDRITY